MEITVRRRWFTDTSTISALSIDGVSECYVLEDRVRLDDPATPADEGAKIPGATAIPAGRYRVALTTSERAQRGTLWSPRGDHRLPQLLSVPGFTGVRIHAGNHASDTAGCLLVGLGRTADAVLDSRAALIRLMAQLDAAIADGEACWITITEERA